MLKLGARINKNANKSHINYCPGHQRVIILWPSCQRGAKPDLTGAPQSRSQSGFNLAFGRPRAGFVRGLKPGFSTLNPRPDPDRERLEAGLGPRLPLGLAPFFLSGGVFFWPHEVFLGGSPPAQNPTAVRRLAAWEFFESVVGFVAWQRALGSKHSWRWARLQPQMTPRVTFLMDLVNFSRCE